MKKMIFVTLLFFVTNCSILVAQSDFFGIKLGNIELLEEGWIQYSDTTFSKNLNNGMDSVVLVTSGMHYVFTANNPDPAVFLEASLLLNDLFGPPSLNDDYFAIPPENDEEYDLIDIQVRNYRGEIVRMWNAEDVGADVLFTWRGPELSVFIEGYPAAVK